MASDTARLCKGCQTKFRGYWLCKPCVRKSGLEERKPVSEFSKWLAGRKVKTNDGKARCNTCFDLEDAERQALQDASVNVLKRSYARMAQEE